MPHARIVPAEACDASRGSRRPARSAYSPTLTTLEAWGPFAPLDHLKLDELSFLQRAEAFHLDGRVVDEDVPPVCPGR